MTTLDTSSNIGAVAPPSLAAGSMVASLKEITKTYYMGTLSVEVLHGISLDFYSGDYISIMGPSGCGKSTLMNILGCLDVPTSGHFYFDGRNISQLNDSGLARIRNRMIGFVFQTYNLLPRLTALQNVELPLIYGNVRNRKKLAAESLDRVGLADRSDHLPTELSGGQQQRVGIARALATEPSVLLADEPTGNLDSHSTREIIKIIQELNISQSLTVILVTHEPEIARLANRSINIVDGAIVEDRINN